MDSEKLTPANFLWLEQADSTNTWLKLQLASADAGRLSHGFVVAAVEQTAGRGQRGNSWEAEPGCNLTFSVLLRPDNIDAAEQFYISEAVALAVADAVDAHLAAHSQSCRVKWPNDIYVGDQKIAGILIENSLAGRRIDSSICGIGLNVNQREFRSDAPNPVSMAQLTGVETPLEPLLADIRRRLLGYLTPLNRDSLHRIYISRLWRGTGIWQWRDCTAGDTFAGSIASVAPTGHLTIAEPSGRIRTFAFKEVEALFKS